MADVKISGLPASTVPLAGTEVLPIVQGGVTKQVSIANVTAGRAISASDLTISGLTASTALALNASKNVVSVTNTGTGDNVLATSPTLVTPNLGAATATSINKVALTTPSSGSTLTIADGKTLTASNTLTFTGTDLSSVAFGAGGTVAYTANKLSAFASTTSAELAGVISNETGSGSLVFATSPTLTTPVIGAATGTSLVTTAQVTSQKTATTTKVQSVGFQTYFLPPPGTTFTITPASGLAWAFVISEGGGGGGALIFCSYKNTTINIVSSSVGSRSFVASNTPSASQLGIYKSADSSVISFVTGTPWGASVAVCLLGDYLNAVTDPV
jgi:hypothetical protein